MQWQARKKHKHTAAAAAACIIYDCDDNKAQNFIRINVTEESGTESNCCVRAKHLLFVS
jgi:hypothetical protein